MLRWRARVLAPASSRADRGEAGYVYVEQGHNVCGITSQATITTPARVQAKQVEAK